MSDPASRKINRTLALREFLDEVVLCTAVDERIANDPIGIVKEFDRADQEVVALIASTLAYGRVDLLRPAIRATLIPLGEHPTMTLAGPRSHWAGRLEHFVYRMTRGADIEDLFDAIASVLRSHGSLEALYSATDGGHLERAAAFVSALRERRGRDQLARGFRYLLPSPADGSATKRLHMFFRWVARPPDEVDLGLWSSVDPCDLVMPLDTHTSRIARYLGLTDRKATDLKAAIDVTASLKLLRAEDPLFYDFPLAHLGISGSCIHRRSDEHCPSCPLDAVCTLA